MGIKSCQKLTTARSPTIVSVVVVPKRTWCPHLTKPAVATTTFETIFVPILINLWNRKTTILIDLCEKKNSRRVDLFEVHTHSKEKELGVDFFRAAGTFSNTGRGLWWPGWGVSQYFGEDFESWWKLTKSYAPSYFRDHPPQVWGALRPRGETPLL